MGSIKFKTSKNDGHRHTWNPDRVFTSVNDGHKHKINLARRIALPIKKGGHTHKLLKIRGG